MPAREVCLEHLRPHAIEKAMRACPTLFLPLGTIEWHGYQNIVGLDALKAQALCIRAAQKGGGLVHPPVYGGVGGLQEPHTFIMDPEDCTYSQLLRPWLEKLVIEAARLGFKAVLIVTGHYGAGQQITVRETAVRMSKMLNIPVLGTPEYFLALDAGYHGDHAATGETALMLELDPPSVDLTALGEEPHKGVYGLDPKKHATKKLGKKYADVIVRRLATLAKAMPAWNEATLQAFIRAEDALASRQLYLSQQDPQKVWMAWRNISQGVADGYAQHLVAGNFDAIVEMTHRL